MVEYMEVEMVLNMRFSYNLLILSILLVCSWFFWENAKNNNRYRKAFAGVLGSAAVLYINRLLGIAMEDGYLQATYVLMHVERIVYYCMSVIVFAFYAYFLLCLLDQFQNVPGKKKILFFTPSTIVLLLIISSPWTKLVYYFEDGELYYGTAFLVITLGRALYEMGASIYALRKRHLLPDIFGKTIFLCIVFQFMQFIFFCIRKSDAMFFTSLLVCIVLLLMMIIVVEFYKDRTTGFLNQTAFENYCAKEIGKRNNKAVYLVKVKNYQYLKENCRELPLQEAIRQLAVHIKEYAHITSVYYLGTGRFCVISSKSDNFHEDEFLGRLEQRISEPFESNGFSVSLQLFIAIMNLESGKIKKENFHKYFIACDDMKYRMNKPMEIIHGDHFGIDQIQRYHDVEEAIERALVEKEFKMFYQPIISTQTGKMVSAEALLRLNDRVLGFVSPEEFIPISENNGKIHEISDFVMESVFRFVSEHDMEEMGLDFIEMNLSMVQCMDKHLPDKLKSYIEKYDVNPKHVNLEITETASNMDEERLQIQLMKMRKMGFTFSLDDYGTGYSNLVRVLEYPVDIVKLDKTIVWSAFHDRDNFVTLKNLISMFHDVRRKLVAEGVESEAQRDTLKELGCDYLQGYFYSKPINEDEFVAYAAKYKE
ncbi:MAG: EAL domain-containing protein [Lachnospiraceae bacterium]|nr:EAL domain-containing protein [Lachnospiraceae bacterium]